MVNTWLSDGGYYQHIDGVDYRHNIFLFLSNTGGREITQIALNNWEKGRAREVSDPATDLSMNN